MQLNSSLSLNGAALQYGDLSTPFINFPIEQQMMTNWCWASVSASVCRFYSGPNLNQKAIVAKVTNKQVCAIGPLIPYCNDTADVGVALNSVGHLYQKFDHPLTSPDTLNTLKNGHLIGCQLYLPTLGGGHAVIIYGGYIDSLGKLMLHVADPADKALFVTPYQQFLNNYRNIQGQWLRSYLTK